jgi:hypothetical protein
VPLLDLSSIGRDSRRPGPEGSAVGAIGGSPYLAK